MILAWLGHFNIYACMADIKGMKGWLKNNTNIFNGFHICLDTNFMNPG